VSATLDTTWRGFIAAVMVTVLSVAGLFIVRSYNPGATAGAAAGGHTVTGPHAAGGSPLANVAASDPHRSVEVILQLNDGTDAAAGRQLVTAAGGEITRNLPIIDGLGARLDAIDAQRLSTDPAFRAVSLNAKVKSQGYDDSDDDIRAKLLGTSFNQSIRSSKAWKLGYTGAGVGVAVIDTGIQGDLPDFRNSRADATSRVSASAVVNPAASTAADTFGHGTHVAGLIAGNNTARPAGDPLAGKYVGAAPDASLISVKAADDQGNTTVLDVIDGLQFVVDHKADLGIRVVNLSLRSTQAESYLTDPLDAAVEAAWNSGIVVVVAAGNDGKTADAVSYAPANDPYVITVGGVDDMGTKTTDDDTLASWSSRGTTQDGFVKPDVLAPGAHLVSTIPAGSSYTQLCPTCVVNDQYFQVGGTSMAAGVVSGGVADILQAHPSWTPDQVKTQLIDRSRPVYAPNAATFVDAQGTTVSTTDDVPRTIDGGEIDVKKAINKEIRAANANAGLTPNVLIDPATGQIDYSRASWSRASWSDATDPLRASWSRASWSRASWSRASWSATPEACADLERASWSRASWSRASWSRASWSRASWSADGMTATDLTADDYSQIDAEIAQAKADCATLLSQVDPSRASWSRASWSRASWSTSFTK
jgi:serine protease AprX